MYATWPCPLHDGGMADEMVMGADARRKRRVLIVAPLLDEANKFRHQLAEIMRRLDALGLDSFLPDLPGCNESLQAHAHQTIEHWRTCVQEACFQISATDILAIRSGCWLVPTDARSWLYAPVKPAQVLRSLVRTRLLSAKEAGKQETAETLLETARHSGIELAGWSLGPQLIAELENARFSPPPGSQIIDHEAIGGKPLWLRAENDWDPAQADAIATIVSRGASDK